MSTFHKLLYDMAPDAPFDRAEVLFVSVMGAVLLRLRARREHADRSQAHELPRAA